MVLHHVFTSQFFSHNQIVVIDECCGLEMQEILAACDRSAAGPTAPAHGLTMIGLEYEDHGNDRTPSEENPNLDKN